MNVGNFVEERTTGKKGEITAVNEKTRKVRIEFDDLPKIYKERDFEEVRTVDEMVEEILINSE